jgi:hypothetical protein
VTLVLLICLFGLLGSFCRVAHSQDQPLRTVDEYIRAIQARPASRAQARLIREFLEEITQSRIEIATPEDAEKLTRFLVEVIREGGRRAPMDAARFLAAHPHPAAAPALFALIDTTGSLSVRTHALEALVGLRHEGVLPILLNDLERPKEHGHERTIQLLGELGDPRALEVLERIAEHPDQTAARRAVHLLRAARDGFRVRCAFDLSGYAYDRLRSHGFVIIPEAKNEMYEFYGQAYPFVTVDVVFHTFMILMRACIHETEILLLKPRIGAFSRDMLSACLEQAKRARDPRTARGAFANAAFFAVPAALCHDLDIRDLDLPSEWEKKARTVLERIRAHQRVDGSVLFGYSEDYTQYKPRGLYSNSPELTGYFQGLRYLGRMQFRLESDEDTDRACLLVDLLRTHPELRGEWEMLDRVMGQLFGERDDLTFEEYEEAMYAAGSRTVGRELITRLEQYLSPRINTAYIPWPESTRWKKKTRGLRIFGQRYTRPVHLMQQTIDQDIWPPTALHVVAGLLGLERARTILSEQVGAIALEQLKLPLPAEDPLRSLSDGALHCLRPLSEPSEHRPGFMSRAPWHERLINSALGAWAEVRHATLLYTKDAHYYSCCSAMTDRFHGYVDPYPRFYERLNALVQRVVGVLDESRLFTAIESDLEKTLEEVAAEAGVSADSLRAARMVKGIPYVLTYRFQEEQVRLRREDLEEFSSILQKLQAIAAKELRGEAQSISDGFFLKGLGGRFKHLAFNRSNSGHARESMAIVSDVATEYLCQETFEVGVGRPLAIYVAIADEGCSHVCKGAIYTYYEFTYPFDRRLNDAEWKQLARYPDETEVVPWIATRPELGLQRTLPREELGALRGCRKHPGLQGRNRRGTHPWRVDAFRDAAKMVSGSRVAPCDLDLLFMAGRVLALTLSPLKGACEGSSAGCLRVWLNGFGPACRSFSGMTVRSRQVHWRPIRWRWIALCGALPLQ